MNRRYASYSAAGWSGTRQHRRFLRTARLNAVGLSALTGTCLATAACCALALRRSGWPLVVRAALGPIAVLGGLVLLDRRKWSRTVMGYSFTDDLAEARAVADQLTARGLPVSLEERPPGRPVLRFAHRDARRVHAALESIRVDAPTF